jgi:Zn-dependent protease
MKNQGILLGKILNIPVNVDYSWFLIFILLTWSLAISYYPSEFKQWPTSWYWILGAITTIMLFISVLLHELGHSFVALRYKIPVRNITLFIFGGVAQISSEPPTAMSEFWIAIAGPVVSFLLAGMFALLELIVASLTPLFALMKYLAYINGTLGLFNLIPGFPLDGGRVFRAILWGASGDFRKSTRIAAGVGRAIAYIFILVGVYFIFSGNFSGGIWIAFIGWFLENAAKTQTQHMAVRDLLSGRKVSQAMSHNYAIISPTITLQRLTDMHILGEGRRFFIVQDENSVRGVLTLQTIRQIPRDQWLNMTAEQAMIQAGDMQWVRPESELWDALERMDQNGVNQLPVIQDDQIAGLLTRENIISFLRTLQEFKSRPWPDAPNRQP